MVRTLRVLVRHGAARRCGMARRRGRPSSFEHSILGQHEGVGDLPPLPFVDLLVARNFDGAITSRFANGAVGNSWPEA